MRTESNRTGNPARNQPLEEVSGERWQQKWLTFSGRTHPELTYFYLAKSSEKEERLQRKIKPAGKNSSQVFRFSIGNLETHRFPYHSGYR